MEHKVKDIWHRMGVNQVLRMGPTCEANRDLEEKDIAVTSLPRNAPVIMLKAPKES